MPSRSGRWPQKRAERLALCTLLAAAPFAIACGDARHRIGNAESGVEDLDGDGVPEARIGRCDWDADLELIDDLEDDDYALNARGRVGTWFAFNDKGEGATQEPRPNGTVFPIATLEPARRHSRRGVHTYGSGFVAGEGTFGGGVGLDLDQKRPYDASRYAGIAFFARSAGESITLRADVTDRYTSPLGGACVEELPRVAEAQGVVACFANWGEAVLVTSEWQAFVVPWSKMTPTFPTIAPQPAPATDALYNVQFQTTNGTTSFDFYIDDVAFLCHPPGR